MAVNRGLFVRATGTAPNKVGTTPIESRLALAGMVAENSPGVPRTGVLAQAGAPAVVTASSGGMTYGVTPCEVVISRSAGEGVYILSVSGTTNVATDPAPGTAGQSRWDIIYVKQNDTDKGDANNRPVLDVVKGTAATSPTKPAVPTGAVALAEARIYQGTTAASGGSNTITQVHSWTAMRGAPIPVKNLADRQTITGPATGQAVIRLDCDAWVQRYTGTGTATGWQFEGWRRGGNTTDGDTLTEFGGASAASRQIALWNSVRPYARVLNLYGRSTILCPSISTGTEDINLAISAVATQVGNAQGRARISWTPGYSAINQSVEVEAHGVAVGAGADALVRLWIEVITGSLSVTPNFGTYYHLYFDYQPAAD
jgi:hypothetical protein